MRKIYIKSLILIATIFSQHAFAADYYLRSGTGVITNINSWSTTPDGLGANPPGFSGNNTWHFTNRTGATLNGNFTPPSTATSSIHPNFNLSVTTNFGQLNQMIHIASGGTLTIANSHATSTYNFQNLDAGSTVIYNTSSKQVVNANYGNLVINANTSLAATATNVWVYGTLTINSGITLTMNGNGLRLNGNSASIAGSGLLRGDNAAFIELYGGNGGNNGALNFAPGFETLDYLYLQYDLPSDYISLGSNLTINLGSVGTFFQALGSFNLNGFALTVSNTADASFTALSSDGVIMGSSTSGLFLNGTIGGFSGGTSLFMDAINNRLATLALNSPGGTLDISSALIISDSLSVLNGDLNTNGNVTLQSTSALKGRLGRVGGNVNGNLTVQTFALGGSTGWAQLGVSGISGQTFNNWYGQIPMAIEGSTTGVTSAGGYYFESVQGWDETNSNGYDTTLTVNSSIDVGKGYWIYLGTGLNTTANMVWSVSGSPVIGPVNIPLTNSAQGGYNLIANPYSSPISWTRLRNANSSVNNATYVYNADGGVYASFVNGVGTNGGSDVIPMGQGFYVEATGNTNLSATEDVKTTANTGANQLLKGNAAVASPGLIFKLKLNGPFNAFDETALRFHANATPTFDGEWDAHKIFATPGYAGYPGAYSKYTTISSKDINNDDYSINSLPLATTQSVSIPVLVKVAVTGAHTITPVDIQNFATPSCVVLRDKLLNINHPLVNGPYVCNISDTTSAPRFELIVCAQNMATSVGNQAIVNNNIFISQDNVSAFVTTNFNSPTKATISAYNVIGQKLMDDVTVNGTETLTRLNFNVNNQVVLIKVTTSTESVTKKIIVH